jgi:selenide,water dikinase
VRFASEIDEASQMLLFDPQTSGGLLLSVPPSEVGALFEDAARLGQNLWVVGEVIPGEGIEVIP